MAAAEVAARAAEDVADARAELGQDVREAPHGVGVEGRVDLADADRHDLGEVGAGDRLAAEEVALRRLLDLFQSVGDIEEPLQVGHDLAHGRAIVVGALEELADPLQARLSLLVAARDRAHALAVEGHGLEQLEVARPARVVAAELGEVEVETFREDVSPARQEHDRVLLLEPDLFDPSLAEAGAGAGGALLGVVVPAVEEGVEEGRVVHALEAEGGIDAVEGRVVVNEEAVEEGQQRLGVDGEVAHELRAELPEGFAVVVVAAGLHHEPGLLEAHDQALERAREGVLQGLLQLVAAAEGGRELVQEDGALGLLEAVAQRLPNTAP